MNELCANCFSLTITIHTTLMSLSLLETINVSVQRTIPWRPTLLHQFIYLLISKCSSRLCLNSFNNGEFIQRKFCLVLKFYFLEIWKIQKMSLSATPTHNLQECGGQCWREAILIYCELCKCPSNFSICTMRGLFQIFVQLLWISFL